MLSPTLQLQAFFKKRKAPALRLERLRELSEGHVAREILSCAGEESFFNLLNGVAVSDLHMQSSYGSQLLKLKLKC